jgi:hypothetical protein
MIWFYGDRTFLDDNLFASSDNIEFHSASTKPEWAGITIQYAEIGNLELSESE